MAEAKRVESLRIYKDEDDIWCWSARVDGWKQSGALCCGEDAGDHELREALPAWIKHFNVRAHVERWVPPIARWLQFGAKVAE